MGLMITLILVQLTTENFGDASFEFWIKPSLGSDRCSYLIKIAMVVNIPTGDWGFSMGNVDE